MQTCACCARLQIADRQQLLVARHSASVQDPSEPLAAAIAHAKWITRCVVRPAASGLAQGRPASRESSSPLSSQRKIPIFATVSTFCCGLLCVWASSSIAQPARSQEAGGRWRIPSPRWPIFHPTSYQPELWKGLGCQRRASGLLGTCNSSRIHERSRGG